MRKITILGLLLLIALTAAFLIYREGTMAVNKSDKSTKIFVINKGESLNEIANKLSSEGLIRNKIVFYLLIKKIGAERKIQAGDFRLSPSMNLNELIKTLQHGTLDMWVTVIEGLRKEEIAQILSRDFSIPEVEFVKLAPEGYLFPDTYLIPTNATSETVINLMRGNFDKKYTSEIDAKAKKLKLTKDQVVTLASLVEREAKFSDDRQAVANILLRRLKEDMPLQIDATVQYVLGYQPYEKTWWKKNLTTQDLKIDSFYNTYKYPGLPPGPISNPGLSAIEAVVNADENTPYLFYVSDNLGHLHFAKNLEEHEQNIQKYLK